MRQPEAPHWLERRRDPRVPKAFAFWYGPGGRAHQRRGGWMLDMSAGGAAFIAPTTGLPAVGDRLEFAEMPVRDRFVREDAAPLPQFGRVVRLDHVTPVTSRIAVRFEVDAGVPLQFGDDERARATARPGTLRRRSGPSPTEYLGDVVVAGLRR